VPPPVLRIGERGNTRRIGSRGAWRSDQGRATGAARTSRSIEEGEVKAPLQTTKPRVSRSARVMRVNPQGCRDLPEAGRHRPGRARFTWFANGGAGWGGDSEQDVRPRHTGRVFSGRERRDGGGVLQDQLMMPWTGALPHTGNCLTAAAPDNTFPGITPRYQQYATNSAAHA
jgi:hypothetical protein